MSIEYAVDRSPTSGQTQSIVDGIEWLRMPLPFALEHINLWLLRDAVGWAIVDTGFGDDTTLQHWNSVFDEAMHGDPATAVLATHMHPDHIGCAGHLSRHFDVDFWISRDEYLLCRILVADTGRPAPEEGLRFYTSTGFTDEQLEKYKSAFGLFGRFVTPLPEAHKRLRDGDQVNLGGAAWQVITGGGHSPEHASLYDAGRNILISGDQLLPTISSIVGVWPTEPDANPLAEWFKSLRKLRQQVPEDVLVLPSHGQPFRGAHGRIDALIAEHDQRLVDLLECCREPRRIVDTFASIFRSKIDDSNRIMAVAEAQAHMNYLIANGDVECEDKDDVCWYQTV